MENDTPSYWVEHLATFAVGREFGLQYAEDGVRKLKQLENSSAIWAQPMVLRLRPNVVSVEDENGVRITLLFTLVLNFRNLCYFLQRKGNKRKEERFVGHHSEIATLQFCNNNKCISLNLQTIYYFVQVFVT